MVVLNEDYVDIFGYIGTGNNDIIEEGKILPYKFGKFDVDVIVDEDEKFLGIRQIEVNKSFLNKQQRMQTVGYLDVEQYYED